MRVTHNVTPSATKNLIPLLNNSFTLNAFWLRQWHCVPRAGDRHPKFYNAQDNLAEDLGFVAIKVVLSIAAEPPPPDLAEALAKNHEPLAPWSIRSSVTKWCVIGTECDNTT